MISFHWDIYQWSGFVWDVSAARTPGGWDKPPGGRTPSWTSLPAVTPGLTLRQCCNTVGGQNIATFWQDHLVRGLTHKGENHETPRLENVAICCPPTAAIAIRAGSTSIVERASRARNQRWAAASPPPTVDFSIDVDPALIMIAVAVAAAAVAVAPVVASSSAGGWGPNLCHEPGGPSIRRGVPTA